MKNVRWIVHVSDLHFTMQDRNEEYRTVWSRFCTTVRDHLQRTAGEGTLIVCTGDVFHEKTQLSSRVVELASRCLRELCDLAPVLLIAGNHDFLQQNPGITDSIQAVCGEGFHPNLRYLRTTGCYETGNIGFGVLSVFDALRVASAGRNPEAEFPAPAFSATVKHRVALFHGTIQTSRFFQGYRAPEGHDAFFPVEMFRGYDLALLGDNHRAQVHPAHGDVPMWGYAGSLVQQNFGEAMERGFLLWDLQEGTARFQSVPSDWAFVTVRPGPTEADLEWIPAPDREWMTLTAAQARAWPPHLHIRAVVPRTTHDVYQQVAASLRGLLRPDHTIDRLVLVRMAPAATGLPTAKPPTEAELAQAPEVVPPPTDVFPNVMAWVTAKVREHCSEHLPKVTEWFRDPNGLVPWDLFKEEEEHSRTVAYKRDMLELLGQAQNVLGIGPQAEARQPSQWRLVRLEWDNVLCYGRGNVLSLEQPGLWLVRGENGRGKSSLLDVLCLALFRSPLRERGRSLVHLLRRGERELQVRCDISVNGVLYRIERKGQRVMRAGKETLVMQDTLWEVGPEGTMRSLVAGEGDEEQNRNEQRMEALIQKLVGTKEDFLTTVLMPQFEMDPFLRRSPAEQRALLQKWLRMDDAERLHAFVQKCEKGWSNLRIRTSARLKDVRERIDLVAREHPWLEATQGTMHPDRARRLGELECARDTARGKCEDCLLHGIHSQLLYPTEAAHEEAMKALDQEEAAFRATERPALPADAEVLVQKHETARNMVAILDKEIGTDEAATIEVVADPTPEWGALADLQKQRKKVRKELDALEETRANKETQKPRNGAEYDAVEHRTWEEEMARAQQERFAGRTIGQARTELEEIEKKLRRRAQLEMEVDSLTKATQQVPAWNHDCWACRQNPAVVRHQEMVQTKEQRMLELMGLPPRDALEKDREVWFAFRQWEQETEVTRASWEVRKAGAEKHQSWQREMETLDRQVKELRKEKKRLQKGLDAWEAWTLQQKRASRVEWSRQLAELAPQVQEIESLRRACAAWDAQREKLEGRRGLVTRSLRRLAWMRAHEEQVRYQQEYEAELRQVAKEEEIHRQYHQWVAERERWTQQMTAMMETLDAAGWMLRFLASDKPDSYVQGVMGKVLPWLVDRVHEWIGDAADFRLGLVPSSDGKGPGGMEFVLLQPATDIQVPVSMASGYQQFLLGLCVRMALLQLSLHRCQHMFLDEGFTACDQANLHRMPGFLKRIRDEFHSVLLISHLDVIAHAADRVVPIDGGGEGSQLSLGVRRTPVPDPTPAAPAAVAQDAVPYARRTVAELHKLCQERGVAVLSKAKKSEIIAALEAADQRV